MTAVRLAEAGQVELDGSVAGQLRHWQLPDPGRRHPTVRQLLTHRGGVNVSGVPGYHPDGPTLLECLEGRGGHEAVAGVIDELLARIAADEGWAGSLAPA